MSNHLSDSVARKQSTWSFSKIREMIAKHDEMILERVKPRLMSLTDSWYQDTCTAHSTDHFFGQVRWNYAQ